MIANFSSYIRAILGPKLFPYELRRRFNEKKFGSSLSLKFKGGQKSFFSKFDLRFKLHNVRIVFVEVKRICVGKAKLLILTSQSGNKLKM